MEIICSPKGIIDRKRPGQGVMDIAGAGFGSILLDLSMGCSEYELEAMGKKRAKPLPRDTILVSKHPKELYHVLEGMVEKCRAQNLDVPVARAPFLCRDTKHQDLDELIVTLTEESIKICGRVGCGALIVRPISEDLNFYLGFADLARENHVMILLENECRDFNGHLIRGFLSDPSEAAEWVDELNRKAGEERFGFCMDAGTCSLCGQDMQQFAAVMGSRMKAVIVRDCDGHSESSMLPFTSVYRGQPQTDWLGLIRGLRENGFDGRMILDISDTAAAFSPILRSGLLKLAKSMADYLKWQIEIEKTMEKYSSIVLFGAGNMCRNYMKCYGEAHPPLFTCDNNRSLWGSRFCGLEVKPPESLLDLQEDCAVVICNIYYREIEKQLRDMGIKNPIEFFNDEYMPDFYFDRLEDR